MHALLCTSYFAVLLLLSMYGLHRSHLVLTCLRQRKKLAARTQQAEQQDEGKLPYVTVQLPQMPSYHEQVLLDELVKKLQTDHGEPPKRPKPAPPPAEADAGADVDAG